MPRALRRLKLLSKSSFNSLLMYTCRVTYQFYLPFLLLLYLSPCQNLCHHKHSATQLGISYVGLNNGLGIHDLSIQATPVISRKSLLM